MMKLKVLKKYSYFFYYTKKTQIINRILSYFKRPLSQRYIFKKKYYSNIELNSINLSLCSEFKDPSEILNNKFTFLNTSTKLETLDSWCLNNNDTLWNFHLNYFDYLLDLVSQYNLIKDSKYLEKGQELIDEWIKNSTIYNKVTWAPFTISLRLINWISFYSDLIKKNFVSKIPVHVIDSIYKQNEYLKLNLENDVLGNHLFENIKTIILVEHFFNRKSSTQKYIHKMNKLLSKQLYKDGCHIEKSISYHIIVLNGVFDILENLKSFQYNLNILTTYANLMYKFFLNIRYSDKDYPLFNDSNFTMTERIGNIDSKASKVLSNYSLANDLRTLSSSSGYLVHKSKDLILTIDLGDLGPDYLLAHAHNDIFNFELIYFGEKFIIDTGVYEYTYSENRIYSKSTGAHNTVKVSNFEQSDVWGSFRIAYRPKKVTHKIKVNESTTSYNGSYKYKKKYIHNRTFFITKKNSIIITDIINSKQGFACKSFLNLSPKTLLIDKNTHLELKNEKNSLMLYTFIDSQFVKTSCLEVNESKWFPEFGIELNRKTITHEFWNQRSGFVISVDIIKYIDFDENIIVLTYDDGIKERVELN